MISLSQDLRLPALLRRLQAGVIVCALIITGPGLSQDTGQPDSTETDSLYFPMQYDSVIVTASRAQVPPGETGLSIDQVSKTSLRNLGVTGPMAQVLEEVPGVFVQDRGNLSLGERITIRGVGTRAQFGVRGIMIVVDNIPLTLPDGQAQTNNIQWNSIQQIEVLRGPSASLYGNAAGGVIRLQTGIPKHTGPMALRVRQEFGSYGQRQTGVSLMGEKNRFSYLAGLSHTATEGFRDHSESSFTRINLKSRYGFSDQMSVTGVINYYNAPYLLNPSSLGKQDARENPTKARDYIQSQGAGEQVWQGQAGVTLNYRFGADEYLESTLYGAT